VYVIVVGAGNIGTPLVGLATEAGNEVVAVERDDAKANALAKRYDCLVLNADATTRETLVDAGAEEADALISTTDRDATNVMVCLLARDLSVPTVVSVVHDPEHTSLFRRVGVQAVENPQQLIAEYLYRSAARPAIVDYMHVGGRAEVFEIYVTEGAPIAGVSLTEAVDRGLLPEDVLIVAVARDDNQPLTPRGGTVLQSGDLLTVFSGHGASPELTDVFGHNADGDG